MTVSNTTRSVDYSGAGTTFGYPFLVYDEDHLVVIKTESDGVTETLLTKTTHYTVTGVGSRTGGTVVLNTPNISSEALHIERVVPYTQLVDYINSGVFTPDNYEEGLDLAVMAIQQLAVAAAAASGGAQTTIYTTATRPVADLVPGLIIYVEDAGIAGEFQGSARNASGTAYHWTSLGAGFPT